MKERGNNMRPSKGKAPDKYRVLDSTGKTRGYVRAISWMRALEEAIKWHGWDVTVTYVGR
jgi:hypothetical protein